MENKTEKTQFETFSECFKKAHPSLQKNTAQKEAIKQWNEAKKVLEKFPNSNIISEKMQEFKLKESQLTSKRLSFWQNFRKSGATSKTTTKAEEQISEQIPTNVAEPGRESNDCDEL